MHKAARGLDHPKCMTCGSVVHDSADCLWEGQEHLRCYKCREYGHWMRECKEPWGCFQCGSFGHWVEDCRYPKGCYNCGQYDHFRPDCPWKNKSIDFEYEASPYPDIQPAAVIPESPARSLEGLEHHRQKWPRESENIASSGNVIISPQSGKKTRTLRHEQQAVRVDQKEQDKLHVTQGEKFRVTAVKPENTDNDKDNIWQDGAMKTSSRLLNETSEQAPESLKGTLTMDGLANSSTDQEGVLVPEQLENALDCREQRHSLELNWRESIVDLLKLTGLASDIQLRSRLAELPNVKNSFTGSAEQNMFVRRALIQQEVARNGGDLPRDTKNQLVGLGKLTSMAEMDSDESEVESIFSDHSTASSMSSSSQTANLPLQIAHLLLNNNALSPLLDIAYARYSTRKVTKKLTRLVSYYGCDLVSEASDGAHRAAAEFVRKAARRITAHLIRSMATESKKNAVSNRKELGKLLLAHLTRQEAANDPKGPLSDTEAEHSEQSESENDDSLPKLQEIEQFMVQSKAFIIFIARIRDWLGVLDELVDENVPIKEITRSPEIFDSINSAITDQTAYAQIPELSQQGSTLQALTKNTNQSFLRRVLSAVILLEQVFWPRPPEGFKRITWRSPLGKPLYIDVKEREDGAAQRLQERFMTSAQGRFSTSGSSSSSSSIPRTVSSGTPAPVPRAPPAAHVINGASSHPTIWHPTNRAHSQLSSTVLATGSNNIRQASGKYLLVCFSTSKSEILKQIDVMHFGNDQTLFEALRLGYNSIREEESWTSKIPLLRSGKKSPWLCWALGHCYLYTPRKINFVSFTPMPLGPTPTPFNIKTPSIPPKDEVLDFQNWHYSPCPIEIEEWAISEAFAAKLLEPGHAFPNAEWLELFPKKLRSFVYEPGKTSMLWGINIVEGLNKAALLQIALCVMILSTLLGLVYSLASHDVSAAFALAGWFASSMALLIPYLQFKE